MERMYLLLSVSSFPHLDENVVGVYRVRVCKLSRTFRLVLQCDSCCRGLPNDRKLIYSGARARCRMDVAVKQECEF